MPTEECLPEPLKGSFSFLVPPSEMGDSLRMDLRSSEARQDGSYSVHAPELRTIQGRGGRNFLLHTTT
jgi:hypothetical protein